MLHGTYDFILTMGGESDAFASASVFVWLVVYIGGLVYARYEAIEFARACPAPVNIHSCINNDDVRNNIINIISSKLTFSPYF